MKSAVTDCDLILYADDTRLLFSNENVSSIEKHVNVDLIVFVGGLWTINYLYKWGKKIKLNLFYSKR